MDDKPILAALQYASLGWHVFPIQPKSKKPFSKEEVAGPDGGGLKAATRDPALIQQWWKRWPDANIGIATGIVSGIVVIDVDHAKEGAWSLESLRSQHKLPNTLTSNTGNGGMHLIYTCNEITVPCSVSRLGPGIDIRGCGGYIVAPPSIHPNGNPYRWSISPYRHPEVLMPLPFSLTELLAQNVSKPSHHEEGVFREKDLTDKEGMFFVGRALERVHAGEGRNHAGFYLSCQLRDWGFLFNQALRYMRFFVNMVPKRDHPYTIKEARQSLHSAYETGRRAPAAAEAPA